MGTHYQGSAAEIRALDLYVKLMRAAGSVSAGLNPRLGEAGLTESQFGVLEALVHRGPLAQCDLAQKILKSSGNVTLVVDNLERRRLVERRRDRGDRRFVTVHLTAEGEALVRRVLPGHVAAIVERLGVLAAGEQEDLARLCRKLGRGAVPSAPGEVR